MDAQANISRIAILGPYLTQIWVPISELTGIVKKSKVLVPKIAIGSCIDP